MTGESLELVDRAGAAEAIRRMGEEDLRYLNRLIVERLKLIHQARSTAMLAHFSVGDRVSFQSSHRRAQDRHHRPAQQEDGQHPHRRRPAMERPPGVSESRRPRHYRTAGRTP